MSGLVQRGVKFSPFSVKRALENTATFLGDLDRFAQGFGLLQVCKIMNFRYKFKLNLNFHGIHLYTYQYFVSINVI